MNESRSERTRGLVYLPLARGVSFHLSHLGSPMEKGNNGQEGIEHTVHSHQLQTPLEQINLYSERFWKIDGYYAETNYQICADRIRTASNQIVSQ
jgi:hypothetical protein